jgi:hypothetical protein
MDDAYYRSPVGSREHYAAYEKEFNARRGGGYAFPDDVRASYQADNAYELARERRAESGDPGDVIADEDTEREDRYTLHPGDPDLDPEIWLEQAPRHLHAYGILPPRACSQHPAHDRSRFRRLKILVACACSPVMSRSARSPGPSQAPFPRGSSGLAGR